MKHKNVRLVLLRRIILQLCKIVALASFFIFLITSSLSANAIDTTIDVVVNNAASAEISFGSSDPDYDFNLTLGACEKITRHVTVATNSPNGYTLYMAGGNTSEFGTNTLTNDTYSTSDTNIFKSVTSPSTCNDMRIGNQWGYALAESASASTFNAIPASDEQISVSSTATGTYPITIAVTTTDAIAADYSGSLIFTATTAVAPTYFAIYYNDNYSGTYFVDHYSGTDFSHDFTIISSSPTRAGYNFVGWSFQEDQCYIYTSSGRPGAECHSSGDQITLHSDPGYNLVYGPVITLYAIWREVTSPAPVQSTALPSTQDNNAESGHVAPQGVKEEIDSSEGVSGNGNLIPAILSLVVAAVATGGFIFFIVAKRDDDDDEEEVENNQGGAVK